MAHRSKNRGEKNARFIPRGPAGEKRCTKCGMMRPIGAFNIDKSRFDGRGYICSACRDARRTKPGPTIRERRERRSLGLAWCAGCIVWKPAAEIHAGFCQPCQNQSARRRYAEDPAFRDRRKVRAIARRRGIAPIPLEGRENIFEEFDGRCAYCPAPATTWDHVVALKNDGLTEPYNIVPACGPCNSSKRTQNVWTWMAKTGRTPHDMLISRLSLYHASPHPSSGPDPFE